MSNAWRDDGFYGQPWVRVAGPIAAALYQAAEDYCHRELSGAVVPIRELGILLPWPLRPGEMDGAIEVLERLGRFERDLDSVSLPRYFVEQESDEAQKTARARRVLGGKARAATASRDALGKMTKRQQESSYKLDASSSLLANAGGQPASGPVRSGPVLSGPDDSSESSVPSGTINPSPSAPGKRERKKPTGDHPELIALWCQLFEETVGERPTIQGSKDGPAVARLLKAPHSREVIEERMRRCFDERNPEWAWRDGPPTLAAFCSASIFDKLAVLTPFARPVTNGHPKRISFMTVGLENPEEFWHGKRNDDPHDSRVERLDVPRGDPAG